MEGENNIKAKSSFNKRKRYQRKKSVKKKQLKPH